MSEKTYPQYVVVHDKRFGLMIPRERLQERIAALADRIAADYGDGSRGVPVFVCVLKGAFMFFAELVGNFDFPCEVSFLRVSSYSGTGSTGQVRELMKADAGLEGRHVVLVEDIVETGTTIDRLCGMMHEAGAASVEVAAMLFKPELYRGAADIRYRAMEIGNAFIVGYGLDYDGLGRNLRNIYALEDE